MSRAIAAHHGKFGRACLYELDRSMAMHAHREGHLIFLLEGPEPQMHIAGKPYTSSSSVAIAINPLQPHDLRVKDDGAVTLMLVLYINPLWFLEAGDDTESALRFGQSVMVVSPLMKKLVQCVAELLISGDHRVLFDTVLFDLTQLCRDQSWHDAPEERRRCNTLGGIRDHRVRKATRLMKERLGNELLLDDIANDSALSRPHFYKLFRENVGITPNVYLNTLRMECAIDRLVSTNQAVTSIGLDLGFASQASFSRFFVSNVGIPPTDYRRVAHH